jgi:hypothetical protein
VSLAYARNEESIAVLYSDANARRRKYFEIEKPRKDWGIDFSSVFEIISQALALTKQALSPMYGLSVFGSL